MNIRKFRFSDHLRSDRSFNALVIGPSASRKNACIQHLIEVARPRKDRLVVVTDYPKYYQESTFDARGDLPFSALDKADCRVLEGVNLTSDHFQFFESDPGCTTIIADHDYPKKLPRGSVGALDYIIFFGGVQQIRRAWDDFGALIPKLRDFRQIYLACTNEGDRYSDEFMVIKNRRDTNDPNDVLFWGSLTKKHLEDITTTIETTLLLNKVKTARYVELPEPKPHYVKESVVEAEARLPDDDDAVGGGDEEEQETDGEGDEREERGDCSIM